MKLIRALTAIVFPLASSGAFACSASTDSAQQDGEANALTTESAPTISVSSAPLFAVEHQVGIVASGISGSAGEVPACRFVENQEGLIGEADPSPLLPATASSIVLTSTASDDVLVELYEADAKTFTDFPPAFVLPSIADDLRFPVENFGFGWNGVALVRAGQSIAINVPAHPALHAPRRVKIRLNCQPRTSFEAPPSGTHRFRYGGSAAWDLIPPQP